jgi:predicted ATP-dependent endonuclease of OLD family
MKIRAVEIRNYRSLQNIKMTELGDLVILIGKNSSGKSNILEALELFFADLNLQSDYAKAFPVTSWYDKRNQRPMDFIITLEIDNQDLKSIFTEDISKRLNIEDISVIGNRFCIHRKIEVNLWKNVESKLGDIFTIKDGKISRRLTPEKKPEKDVAEKSGEQSQEGIILEAALPAEIANMIFTNIHNMLKNRFKLIRSPRESPERVTTTTRPTIIDPESKAYLNRLAITPANRDEEDIWTGLENDFLSFSNRGLRVRGSVLEFRVGNLFLPIELSGSGDQALMILMRHFLEEMPFYGIEEPETRLHHEYQRKLFRYLKALSPKRQIFLATHSSVFVDKAFLDDTWFTRLDGTETKVKRVAKEDLRVILLELGILPSDFFFANHILLVEGRTEEYVIPIVAERAGLNLSNVSIIPTHGKDRGNYHLEVWVEACRDTNLPIHLLLDKVAEKEIKKLEGTRLLDREHYHMLSQKQLETADACDIEDYYPKDILRKAVLELAKEDYQKKRKDEAPEDLQLKDGEPTVKRINDFLGRKDWKLKVAIRVMQEISTEQIRDNMDEILRFLRRISG